MAAGEALAVCVELNILTGKDIDALTAKVCDLAAEPAGKGANNSLLRDQKELFGRIAAFLDHDKTLAISLRTSSQRHDVIKVSTWTRLVQLNFLGKFLGNGFLNKHVQDNPFLNEAFRIGRVEGKPLSIQKDESGMTLDDFLWDLNRRREWSWDCDTIFNLPRMVGVTERWPEMLLQRGCH
ncbi:unnamed protein product [Urochloa humidicola]